MDASFIVTEAISSLKNNPVLDFLKLRVSYNRNANDPLSPYQLVPVYNNATGFPYGNNVGLTIDNTLPDPNLKPFSYHVLTPLRPSLALDVRQFRDALLSKTIGPPR